MTTTSKKFKNLEADLNTVLIERGDEVHGTMLALAGGLHVFLVGEPGIAKSMLFNQLAQRIELPEGGYFKWLMTQHTTPEEIFGPPSFAEMRENDRYVRVTDRKLPQASVAFLDEIFKSGSAILNALLTALEEREFENGDLVSDIPLSSMFSASNEIPANGELGALADRLHLWYEVKPIKEASSFAEMLQAQAVTDPAVFLTLKDIETAKREIAEVAIPEDVVAIFIELRERLQTDGIYVSDRRFRACLDIVRAEAWLNDRDTARYSDVTPVQHMLWRDFPEIPKVRKHVLDLSDTLERDIQQLTQELEVEWISYNDKLQDLDSNQLKSKRAIEMNRFLQHTIDATQSLRQADSETDVEHPSLDRLTNRLAELGPQVIQIATGMVNRQND